MKKLKLIEDWRRAWRWVSVQCMILAGSIQGAWVFVPDDMKASIPPNVLQCATLVLLGIGVVGRFVQQTPPACPHEVPK